jgi:hypothetical protein
VIAYRRKLRNEKLNDFYFSLNIIGLVESKKIDGFGMQHALGEAYCIDGFFGKTRGKEIICKTKA